MALPDPDGLVREWLKANAVVNPLVSGRVYFEVPRKDIPTQPFIVLYTVSGGPDDHGRMIPGVIIETWALNKFEAMSLGMRVVEEIVASNDRPPVVLASGVVMAGSVNSGPISVPGTSTTKRARIDATFTLRGL